MPELADWFPLPALPPLVSYTVDACGVFVSFRGPAARCAPLAPENVPGRPYEEVLTGLPEVQAAFRLALSGRKVDATLFGWGRRWFTMLRPEYGPGGAVERIHGTSLLLPEDSVVPDAGGAVPTYRVTVPLRGPGYHLRPGDVVIDDGRVMTTTTPLPERAATMLRPQLGSLRLPPLSPAQSVDAPIAPGAPAPRLKLME